ncbi:MAG: thioesterase [Anaeroplasma sp.]|nr:thioesterase [Anaeroplasma sp.]
MAILKKEMNVNIQSNQCDFKDYLKPSSVLGLFQDIAGIHASELNYGFDDLYNLGYYWVVMYIQFEVVSRIPKFNDTLHIETWPKRRGRLEFEREYEIYDANTNDLLIKGISNWVVIDTKNRLISKAQEVNFSGEYVEKTNYPLKQKRKLNLEDNHEKSYSHTVCLNDIDHNMHMNNSKYLDIIYNMDTVDSYKLWKKIEIAFLHEARIDDMIDISHYIDIDNVHCYKGFINDIACFEVKITKE